MSSHRLQSMPRCLKIWPAKGDSKINRKAFTFPFPLNTPTMSHLKKTCNLRMASLVWWPYQFKIALVLTILEVDPAPIMRYSIVYSGFHAKAKTSVSMFLIMMSEYCDEACFACSNSLVSAFSWSQRNWHFHHDCTIFIKLERVSCFSMTDHDATIPFQSCASTPPYE